MSNPMTNTHTVSHSYTDKQLRFLHKRKRAEQRFRLYGRLAIAFAATMLVILLSGIIFPGIKGLSQTEIALDIILDESITDTRTLTKHAPLLAKKALLTRFPEAEQDRGTKRKLYQLIASLAASDAVLEAWKTAPFPLTANDTRTVWIPASDSVDMLMKGRIDRTVKEADRPLNDQQIAWADTLDKQGKVRKTFNANFFQSGDSRNPVRAGFLGAMIGSLFTVLTCLLIAFPLGVGSAIYLEEFAPRNRLRDIIEVNINNLAAVPSIVFGLLGLSVYLNFFGLPRSAPLVGGMTLALMILPVIIITTRVALASIPDSIRQAALGLGASPLQAVMHHVLPLAIPGIMTGTILGVARAIGETAPLLMIGMVAFIVDIPHSFLDSATVMPVQIYIWASSPELGFVDKTAAGILLLILLLLALNAVAIYVRKRYERRW
jgi:phosphate transport system permease protein